VRGRDVSCDGVRFWCFFGFFGFLGFGFFGFFGFLGFFGLGLGLTTLTGLVGSRPWPMPIIGVPPPRTRPISWGTGAGSTGAGVTGTTVSGDGCAGEVILHPREAAE
jgi:hypothetical protein